jgi:XRE family transcriptional regulator, regulator of sulfur utilization
MSDDGIAELGRRLRALRQERGLSLAEVSDATGISTSFLSHVETGKGDIGFTRLSRLVEFYGVTMMAVATPTHSDAQVVRVDERKQLRSQIENVDVFLLAPSTDGAFFPVLCIFEPGAESGYGAPGSVEFIHVLQGTIEIGFEGGGDTLRLEKGDSAYLANGHAARSYRNVGRVASTYVSVLETSGGAAS